MIAVIADPADHVVVREFFELFKTPWELYSADRVYDVVLCAGERSFAGAAKLVLRYAGGKIQSDANESIQIRNHSENPRILKYGQYRIPVYGHSVTFAGSSRCCLTDEESKECVAFIQERSEATVVRIGYDLFSEVRTLLTIGQPAANAAMPALELHIALLRDAITGCGVQLVEIPPVPAGYGCIACLTHDVDHPSIRQHRWDHTTLGFLYRAAFGSLANFVRGRSSVRTLLRNWATVMQLPFVYIGFSKDFWRDFDDSYLKLEGGLHSTFFVIPFKNRPGKKASGSAPAIRAAAYGAQDIADAIGKLQSAGCEIGLHGIDAWLDSSDGREEIAEIRRLTENSETGVRMHWLYFDAGSPARLEAAGAAYDSTVGYNETVGFRSGTTQVFKPLETDHMLELPLHAMDTALFYPSYLGLSEREAIHRVGQLISDTCELGGVLTTNWHDRSLAPERLWGKCYRAVIQELKDRGAWFATASQAVSWFQKRRSARFEAGSSGQWRAHATSVGPSVDLPGIRLRIHEARKSSLGGAPQVNSFVDVNVDDRSDNAVSSVRR